MLTLFLLLAPPANWPEYRGPHGDGHADAAGLPLTWSESENVRWKTPIHDKGWSSPVIWGDRVWVTTATADGAKLFAVALDRATGKVVHDLLIFETSHPDPKEPFHVWGKYNSYASPTPALAEGRVYVHYGVSGTACLDSDTGKVLWKRTDLPCNHFRGAASSPILHGGRLYLIFDGHDVQYVTALDAKTGETVWKRDREFHDAKTDGDVKKGYATPLVITVNGREQLVAPSAGATAGYDPATGAELWRVVHGGMNGSLRPVYGHGKVFTTSSDGGKQLVAVRPDGSGDVTNTHVAWTFIRNVPNRGSPLLDGDHLYMVNKGGIATCLNVDDGKEVNKVRLDSKGADFTASPIWADGKWYCFDEKGGGFVLSGTPELKVLAANKLADGCKGSPAAIGKSLFVRTLTHVYCLEAK